MRWDYIGGGIGPRSQWRVYAYVMCDAMLSGKIAHSCKHGPPPHNLRLGREAGGFHCGSPAGDILALNAGELFRRRAGRLQAKAENLLFDILVAERLDDGCVDLRDSRRRRLRR